MELRKVKISDALYLKNGFAFKSVDYVSSGIPLIRVGNIQNNEIVLKRFYYL